MIAQARLSRVAGLALPIIAGAMATNLMSVIDTLMVGQLGVASLGGVGIGSQLFFLLVAVALGLAAGVQASVARRVGEGHVHRAGFYLNAGVLIAILAGFVLVPAIGMQETIAFAVAVNAVVGAVLLYYSGIFQGVARPATAVVASGG